MPAKPAKPAKPSTRDDAADDSAPATPWRIAGMSPTAVAAARAAANRAGMPIAVWLSGLIHAVADREGAGTPPSGGQ